MPSSVASLLTQPFYARMRFSSAQWAKPPLPQAGLGVGRGEDFARSERGRQSALCDGQQKATRAMASRVASNPTHYEKADGVKSGHRPAKYRQPNLHHQSVSIDCANSPPFQATERGRLRGFRRGRYYWSARSTGDGCRSPLCGACFSAGVAHNHRDDRLVEGDLA